MEKKEQYILFGIVLVTLAIRLILAFSLPNLTHDSYFHLRQVEHIRETGIPLYNDPLSYGGRTLHFLPLFHYLAAGLSFLLPLSIIVKLIPNLLLSSIPFLVYAIARRITTDSPASLLAAFVSAFLPILYNTNAFIPETLFLPLTFLTLYCFLHLQYKKYQYLYILSFLLLSITSPATVFLLIGFGIYFLLTLIERKKPDRAELELIAFSLFFFLWTQFIFFKENFLSQGISFIWRNIPPQIIYDYLPKISLPEAIVLVSMIPFMAGVYVAYRALFQLKNEKSFLLISFVISTTLLTWSRLISFQFSLTFFSIILAILFATFYHDGIIFLKKTKAPWLHKYLALALVLFLIPTTVLPALNTALTQSTPSNTEIAAFTWLETNTAEDALIAAPVEEGHLITYFSQRKNVMDNNFALIDNAEERFTDLSNLYKTKFQTEAISLFTKYNIQYIIMTPLASQQYTIGRLQYITPDCFELVYKKEIRIYKTKCTLRANQAE